MPETIVYYKCSKCRQVYSDINKCIACEASHTSLKDAPIVADGFNKDYKYPQRVYVKTPEDTYLTYQYYRTTQELPKEL